MKIILSILTLFLFLSSCNEDENYDLGSVTFEFDDIRINEINKMELSIYTAENTNIPLFPNLKPDVYGRLQVKDLNPGNYIYSHTIVNCSGTCIRVAAFQINPGRNKTISIPRQKWI